MTRYSFKLFRRNNSTLTPSEKKELHSFGKARSKFIRKTALKDLSHADSSTDLHHGSLITPIPRKLNHCSAQLPFVEKSKQSPLFRSKRRENNVAKASKVSSFTTNVTVPYLSKSAMKKLSSALRTRGLVIEDGCAWERPKSLSVPPYLSMNCTMSLRAPDPKPHSDILKSFSSSDSLALLPQVISPAFKFVPIGRGNDDDCTISSADFAYNTITNDKPKPDTPSKRKEDSAHESVNSTHPFQSNVKTLATRPVKLESGIKIMYEVTPFEPDHQSLNVDSPKEKHDKYTPLKIDPAITFSTERSSSSESIVSMFESSFLDISYREKTAADSGSDNWWPVIEQLKYLSCGAA